MGRGLSMRFGFFLELLYDTFDSISIIFHGKLEFSSRRKMKKLQM